MDLHTLSQKLRQLESDNNRCRAEPKFGPRTLDIDILLYGDLVGSFGAMTLPRDEITKNAFVLWPLAEIAPSFVHPGSNKTYQQLWEEFSSPKDVLWPVDFIWQNRQISFANSTS